MRLHKKSNRKMEVTPVCSVLTFELQFNFQYYTLTQYGYNIYIYTVTSLQLKLVVSLQILMFFKYYLLLKAMQTVAVFIFQFCFCLKFSTTRKFEFTRLTTSVLECSKISCLDFTTEYLELQREITEMPTQSANINLQTVVPIILNRPPPLLPINCLLCPKAHTVPSSLFTNARMDYHSIEII